MKKINFLLTSFIFLIIVSRNALGIPNPAAVYCHERGYTLQGGNCIFPDDSECEQWQFYCNCEPDGIGCSPTGNYSCHWPCEELPCKEAGEHVLVSECCEGLIEIPPTCIYDANCTETGMSGWAYICSDCPNGICESWESKCNCPEDCDYETINISLHKGWNLISIPLNLTNNTLSEALKSIEGNYSNVFSYINGKWIELKNNDKINETIGFWIKMNNSDELIFEGTEFNNIIFYNLNKGWNLISYPSLNITNTSHSFKEVNDSLAIVYAYINNSWESYDPNKPDNLNSLKELKPGYGYFVKVSEDVRWEFDETNLYFVLSSIVEDYFPLNVGNSWTYVNSDDGSTKTFTIIGIEEINGYTYYKFDDYFKVSAPLSEDEVTEGKEGLFRYNPIADRLLMYLNGEDIIRYDFSGDSWDTLIFGHCRLKETNISCNVPSGEFNDCIKFQFGGTWAGPDAYGYGEYLAPNVGNVKYVVPGGEFPGVGQEGDLVTFELQNYTITPEPS